MESDLYLNSNMIFEILIRTTLETMDTCKIVNKELKELIYDSWFMQNYSQKTKNVFGYFVQTLKNNRHVSAFVPIDPSLRIPSISLQCFEDDLRILASSNQGILCCRKYKDRSYHYYVCKPSTRQSVALPSPRQRDHFFDKVALLILKSNSLHYKIIRFSRARHSPPGKNSYICEIFDSKLWTWRQSKNLVMEHGTVFGHQPSVCVGGVVYWLTSRDSILAFDPATETHSEFAVPTVAFQNKKTQIVEYKEKLGFTCENDSDKLMLWALEDSRNYKWEIKKVVTIDKPEERLIGCNLANTALMMGYRLQVYKQSGLYYPMDIFPFRSDWEPVNLEDGCILSSLEEMISF